MATPRIFNHKTGQFYEYKQKPPRAPVTITDKTTMREAEKMLKKAKVAREQARAVAEAVARIEKRRRQREQAAYLRAVEAQWERERVAAQKKQRQEARRYQQFIAQPFVQEFSDFLASGNAKAFRSRFQSLFKTFPDPRLILNILRGTITDQTNPLLVIHQRPNNILMLKAYLNTLIDAEFDADTHEQSVMKTLIVLVKDFIQRTKQYALCGVSLRKFKGEEGVWELVRQVDRLAAAAEKREKEIAFCPSTAAISKQLFPSMVLVNIQPTREYKSPDLVDESLLPATAQGVSSHHLQAIEEVKPECKPIRARL